MTNPRVVVGSSVRIPIGLITLEEAKEDWLTLSCPNPARVQADRLGAPGASRFPSRLSSMVVTPTEAVYPIAAASAYRARLRDKAYDLADERPTFCPCPYPYRGQLLPFQAAAVGSLVVESTGVLTAPCGPGRGEILVALVGRVGLPALVLVASIDQARELRERFARRLSLEAGLIGAGEYRVENVTIALVQALSAPVLEQIRDTFGLLIVDECHHVAADSYRTALSVIATRRRYGFTATLDRADGLTPWVHHHLGPVRYHVAAEELVTAGRSVEPRFVEVRTTFLFHYRDRQDWSRLLEALANDEQRNELIVEVVSREGEGFVSAVLTARIEHALLLCSMLSKRGLRASVLTGRTAAAERRRVIDAARAREIDVILATQILDEGIDVPSLSRLFLTFPAKAEGRLVQRVGRVLRAADGKADPIVFDFVDLHVGPLANQARQRRNIFIRQWPNATRRLAA